MKIMYLMFSFTTGGMERLVTDICNDMIDKGNQITLYIINNYYADDLLRSVNQKVKVILENREVGSKHKIKSIIKIAKVIKQEHIEIVHCNGLKTPETLFLAKLVSPRIKIFYTIHDMGQYKQLNKIEMVYRNLLCNKIIAISDCVKNDIVSFGANNNKVAIVFNALNINKFRNDNNMAFNLNHIVLGNVARIMPEKKGQDLLIKALYELKKYFPNIKCYFAGADLTPSQHELNKLKDEVKEYNLKENAIFCGNVENVNEFLKNIDIFILPSKVEGFGISLIEALAMGIPCVASNLDGPAEILANTKFGILFEPGNIYSLVQAIKRVIYNYEDYKKESNNMKLYIDQNFNIKNMCKKLEHIYSNN